MEKRDEAGVETTAIADLVSLDGKRVTARLQFAVGPVELLRDVRVVGWIDVDAGVGDAETESVVGARECQFDLAALGAAGNGVVEEGVADLLEALSSGAASVSGDHA